MQQRDSSQDPHVSRGPAQPDGGLQQNQPMGAGGRGISVDEHLEEVQQQAGLDTPYGDRASGQESGTLRSDGGASPSGDEPRGDVGTAQGETPGKVAGTQF
jgi:hypothetical protein